LHDRNRFVAAIAKHSSRKSFQKFDLNQRWCCKGFGGCRRRTYL